MTQKLFGISILGCMGFMLLTTGAMVAYPGGTDQDHFAAHYQFFQNPFSDLGRVHVFNGRSNLVSMATFIAAMAAGAAGLSGFFVGFAMIARGSTLSRVLSIAGAGLGILAAVCFVGVACTPWDMYLSLHMVFVFGAFRSLLVATALDLLAVLADGNLPYRLIAPFAVFIVLLIGYIILLTAGVSPGPWSGAVTQTVGQKMIVYSAIAMVMTQSMQIRQIKKSVAF